MRQRPRLEPDAGPTLGAPAWTGRSSGITEPLLLALGRAGGLSPELLRVLSRNHEPQPIRGRARFLRRQGLELRFLSVRHQEGELLFSIAHAGSTVDLRKNSRQAAFPRSKEIRQRPK